MPAPVLLALLLLAASGRAPAVRPASSREMGGFLLGQYAKAVEAKLGKATRTGTDDDGETLWHYDLAGADGKGTVLSFSLTKDEVPRISMIETTGAPLKSAPMLLGASLGMTKAELIARLGAPDATEPRKETPGETLDWKDRNYYAEVDANGRVDCLEIVDNTAGYPERGDSKPDLEGFRKALESRERDAILEWVSGAMDIYTKSDETVNFAGSPVEDIHNEESLIARYLYGGEGSTRDLLTSTRVATAETEKDEEDEDTWTSSFGDDSPIVDIVWTFEAGKWRVWEINLAPDEEERR